MTSTYTKNHYSLSPKMLFLALIPLLALLCNGMPLNGIPMGTPLHNKQLVGKESYSLADKILYRLDLVRCNGAIPTLQ